jgi:hypothetical protein
MRKELIETVRLKKLRTKKLRKESVKGEHIERERESGVSRRRDEGKILTEKTYFQLVKICI